MRRNRSRLIGGRLSARDVTPPRTDRFRTAIPTEIQQRYRNDCNPDRDTEHFHSRPLSGKFLRSFAARANQCEDSNRIGVAWKKDVARLIYRKEVKVIACVRSINRARTEDWTSKTSVNSQLPRKGAAWSRANLLLAASGEVPVETQVGILSLRVRPRTSAAHPCRLDRQVKEQIDVCETVSSKARRTPALNRDCGTGTGPVALDRDRRSDSWSWQGHSRGATERDPHTEHRECEGSEWAEQTIEEHDQLDRVGGDSRRREASNHHYLEGISPRSALEAPVQSNAAHGGVSVVL